MNKLFKILLLFCFLLITLFCLFIFRNIFWQDVNIDFGTFKVPKDWVITKKDNFIYITDKPINEEDYKIYLIGMEKMKKNNEYRYELFNNVESMGFTDHGVLYSNSARYWVEIFNENGIIKEKYVIVFAFLSNPAIYFLAWDDLVDKKMIIKITKSFTPKVL